MNPRRIEPWALIFVALVLGIGHVGLGWSPYVAVVMCLGLGSFAGYLIGRDNR